MTRRMMPVGAEQPTADLTTVAVVDFFEVLGGPRLEIPDEPVVLKAKLRDAVLAGADRNALCDELCVALWLWESWRPPLEALGYSRENFVDEVARFSREQWLWLIGDRGWLQFVTGLAGRVSRRAPLGQTTSDPAEGQGGRDQAGAGLRPSRPAG